MATAVVQARDSQHPAYGPVSSNLRLMEGWLAQAEAREEGEARVAR